MSGRRDTAFAEIWHHGNVLAFARALCEPHGWTVTGQATDGRSPHGSVHLDKLAHQARSLRYALPENPALLRRRLIDLMEFVSPRDLPELA
jgi:hypothetical protein